MKEDQKSLLIVFALCVLILVGGDFFVKWLRPKVLPVNTELVEDVATDANTRTSIDKQSSPQGAQRQKNKIYVAPDPVLAPTPSIKFETETLQGTLNTRGPFLDNVALKQHVQDVESKDPINLLQPLSHAQPYQVRFVWHKQAGAGSVPSQNAIWHFDKRLSSNTLSGSEKQPAEKQFVFFWENSRGVRFERHVTIDKKGMFFITFHVQNPTLIPFNCTVRGEIERTKPELLSEMLVYEGPLGFLDGSLREPGYESLEKKKLIEEKADKGWLGVADKYWLVAFAPYTPFNASFSHHQSAVRGNQDLSLYSVAFSPQHVQVPAHGGASFKTRLYVGAKKLRVLDFYEDTQGIRNFDKAIDFGWFYFLTKPIFYTLSWLKDLTGNFGLAIILFTVLLKLLFFPLANKSYRSMAKMKRLGPEVERLKARYKDDQQRMSQELMAFYKKEKINPVSGCLPMLLQMPFFFALYKVLLISVDARHAPFFGWISDLSAPDPTNILTLCGLLPITLPAFLTLGFWPFVMGISMFLQQRMSPPPTDPTQRVMLTYGLPLVFMYFFKGFAAGVVIYWTWNNVLSVAQQWVITRFSEEGRATRQKRLQRS